MEKFQKYCLGVLLVIICSNVTAQATICHVESESCEQLYELYSRILSQGGSKTLQEFGVKKKSDCQSANIHGQKAGDLIGKMLFEKDHQHSHINTIGAYLSEIEVHKQLLQNFEKNNKEHSFADILYFKSKVSKVRNKDYLEVIC